jgi:dUTP pyrophosphatase
MNTFYVHKTRPDAIVPFRAHATDTGFDLVLLEPTKSVGDVTFYTTGISVRPPDGFYFDLVARSSLSKTGYMLANGVGIIDRDYTGEILVALRKVDKEAPDLVLPAKVTQLIPRQWVAMMPAEAPAEGLPGTDRGDGGFGSTDAAAAAKNKISP